MFDLFMISDEQRVCVAFAVIVLTILAEVVVAVKAPQSRSLRDVPINIIPIRDVWFDDAATSAMGKAFERASKALRNFGSAITVREIIAKRIIAAAKNGERDPARLCQQALIPFGIEDMSMLQPSVPTPPQPPSAGSAFFDTKSDTSDLIKR